MKEKNRGKTINAGVYIRVDVGRSGRGDDGGCIVRDGVTPLLGPFVYARGALPGFILVR